MGLLASCLPDVFDWRKDVLMMVVLLGLLAFWIFVFVVLYVDEERRGVYDIRLAIY